MIDELGVHVGASVLPLSDTPMCWRAGYEDPPTAPVRRCQASTI